ncbi:FapA family protein [Aestuariibacter sp. AA17]|uniref:FapA family protein n=1 Tax=Fluctibacter corallii TaxID=2984329 RepID=A0ABT3A9Q0_9ALTE|nr:FapA family protein [Aestuariibacter sp. AA17]MCV2885358.1 FapA family protein [Aestuariibacter sp. AA17]
MNGIEFKLNENKIHVDVHIDGSVKADDIDAKKLSALFLESEFRDFFIIEDAFLKAQAKIKESKGSATSIKSTVAEKRDTAIAFSFSDGDLVAKLQLTAPYGGSIPSVEDIKLLAKENGIERGFGEKRVHALLRKLVSASPGALLEDIIAKGLPPKMGKSSKLRPLVPNALERILEPQASGGNRVDMRNLGDVICVKQGTELLRRLPPTLGRDGYTVKGTSIPSKPGDWKNIDIGEGAEISEYDENLVVAKITGMPKFKDQKMWVDETFICTGVNVGTGNINYDGAVLVNGDVTEKMVIIAAGDVTINGFVESATIHAGGDIIITEGAMGKVNETHTTFSSKLVSQGNVHVQHGQGLDINCSGNVTIGRQLAYSRIMCGGSVTVGPVDNPNGNLFASEIHCHGRVIAGTLGAVSGSNLSIDFSGGFNLLLERKETLDELLKQLIDNNTRHEKKMGLIRSKNIHKDLVSKFEEAESMLKAEQNLLHWVMMKAEQLKTSKDSYQDEIRLVANKRLYPGVVVKLNNRTWRAEKEYGRALVFYEGHQWQYEPIV